MIDSANKCEKEATFPHTSHQRAEQAWHHWIWAQLDFLNLSHPHRWPFLWLMRSVAHECLRFCSACLMVTFGCQRAQNESVPHTHTGLRLGLQQWPVPQRTHTRPAVADHHGLFSGSHEIGNYRGRVWWQIAVCVFRLLKGEAETAKKHLFDGT